MENYLKELIDIYGQENAEYIEDYLAGLEMPKNPAGKIIFGRWFGRIFRQFRKLLIKET